jgi:hypothetical protein
MVAGTGDEQPLTADLHQMERLAGSQIGGFEKVDFLARRVGHSRQYPSGDVQSRPAQPQDKADGQHHLEKQLPAAEAEVRAG